MLNQRVLLIVILSAIFSISSVYAGNGHNRPSDCALSAGSMLQACRADVRDNLFETFASCQHISDRADRWECYVSAYQDRAEESAECGDVRSARVDACDVLQEDRYDPDPLLSQPFAEDPYDNPVMVNPYISVEEGHTYVLRAGEVDEDSLELVGEELVVVHVTDETQDVLGIPCRIVVDVVFEASEEDGETEYEVVEATDDLFALTTNGDVIYCGEVSRNYEDGILRDLDGSFEAGIDYAKSGTLMLYTPIDGLAHRSEFAPGEAEDIIQYNSATSGPTEDEGGDNAAFPCGATGCLRTYDFSPLDPESTEFKFYQAGVGFVLAVGMEDGEVVEREERVCGGDSLEVLNDCGIADVDALLEELCKISPDAFCGEED